MPPLHVYINAGLAMFSMGIGAFYLKTILTRLEHATNRRKLQFRMVDVMSVMAILSISFAFVTSLLTWSVLAHPDEFVSRAIVGNIWLIPTVLTPLLCFFSIRELESLAVDHPGKRMIFVIVVAPIAACFAAMLSFSGMVLFQCFEMPPDFPSPYWIGVFAIPVWLLLKIVANWCLTAPATAVVKYVD